MNNDAQKIDGEALVRAIPEDWLTPTQEIAQEMAAAGHRVWIVGGGVRDLILGREIKDIDLVSAALPDEVEALFPKTVPVGKAFGIVIIVAGGKEIEVATFRKERGYSDSRRPDLIEYTDSSDVDAGRRDFTCNALYLDPLTGEISDPTGGLTDLAAKTLRAVGDAAGRFREDGLRLLRAGRFMAALDLRPAPGLLEAMAAEVDSIQGVSPERVLDETSKILKGPDPARAARILSETGVFGSCLPGWEGSANSAVGEACAERLAKCLPSPSRSESASVALGLAVLLDPTESGQVVAVQNRLEELRPSKELRSSVMSILAISGDLIRTAGESVPADAMGRGAWVTQARSQYFEAGAALALAGRSIDRTVLAATIDDFRRLSREAPAAAVELSAKDAMDAGLKPGPLLGDVLRGAKLAALGGAFSDREGALAWLAQQVADS